MAALIRQKPAMGSKDDEKEKVGNGVANTSCL